MRSFVIAALVVVAVVAQPLDEAQMMRVTELSGMCPHGRRLAVTSCNTPGINTCAQSGRSTLMGCGNEIYCACPIVTLPDGECGEWSDCPSDGRFVESVPSLDLTRKDVRLVEAWYRSVVFLERTESDTDPSAPRSPPLFFADGTDDTYDDSTDVEW